MAFFWQRFRRRLAPRSNRPRDAREDYPTLARFEDAPELHAAASAWRLAPHDWTTLWGAAALGYERILDRLLAEGWPLDARDEQGRTALFHAVDSRQEPIVARLLERGADPDLRDEAGWAPLHRAVAAADLPLVQRLLAAGATPDAGKDDGTTPLMEAVRRGEEAIAHSLLVAGADPDARDRFGHTALFYLNGHTVGRTLAALLDAGADPWARARDRDTAIHRALRVGDERLYRALVPADDESARCAERGRMGDTLLLAAADGGHPGLLRRLLQAGAPVEDVNHFGHTALLIALAREHLPAATFLRSAGAPVGFLEAVALGDLARAEPLAPARQADLDAPIAGIETPLMGAVARGRADLVRLLAERGARLDTVTAPRGAALDVAAERGDAPMARLLVALGADPSRCLKTNRETLRRLLRADPLRSPFETEFPSPEERPDAAAIYAAACAGSDDDLRWLRLLGGDLDLPDAAGWTALMLAARDGDAAAVRRLLSLGADPDRRNRERQSAADIARALGRRIDSL